jgi:hypothetical protein
MNRELISQRLSRHGPHIIRTADGQEYIVPHLESVIVGRFSVIFEDPDGRVEAFAPHHIVAIRNAARARGKGGGRRRAA